MITRRRVAAFIACSIGLAGCQPAPPPAAPPAARFPDAIKGLGTEPFWAIELDGTRFAWSSVDAPDPRRAILSRQESDGALVISGLLDGQAVHGTFRKAMCSDGMSDRTYPFALSLSIGQARFSGCAYPGGMRFPAE